MTWHGTVGCDDDCMHCVGFETSVRSAVREGLSVGTIGWSAVWTRPSSGRAGSTRRVQQ